MLAETKTKDKERLYTPEEYLKLEEVAESKSEYIDGQILPMTGGTLNHNRLILNLCLFLKVALKVQQKKYDVFTSDVRLWIPQHRVYTYPDVMIVAGEPILLENRNDTITNPRLIVEVLSKSTKDYDLGDKFDRYRSIAEFQEYLLIDQYRYGVKQFSKTDDGKWLFSEYELATDILMLASVDLPIELSEIYEGISFETGESSTER